MQKIKWDGFIAFFGTDDLEKTDHFYREVLGLTIYKDQGICKIYDVPGGGQIGFCSHVPVTKAEGTKSPILTLLTPHVDQVYERLTLAGITTNYPPQENEKFKIYHFFVLDPNGYTVEIQKFL